MFDQQLVIFLDLLAQEAFLVVVRHADPLERGMRHDDAVPVAAGDLGGQELAAVAGQVFLGGDQQPGVRVELHEFAGELLQQVIGDDVHRFFDEAGLLHLHAGGGHRERLAGPDDMGEQCVAANSCPARRHPSDAGGASGHRSCRGNRDASRRTGAAADCCRCRYRCEPTARCGRDRKRPRRGTAP